jgi:hypothetical protein
VTLRPPYIAGSGFFICQCGLVLKLAAAAWLLQGLEGEHILVREHILWLLLDVIHHVVSVHSSVRETARDRETDRKTARPRAESQ